MHSGMGLQVRNVARNEPIWIISKLFASSMMQRLLLLSALALAIVLVIIKQKTSSCVAFHVKSPSYLGVGNANFFSSGDASPLGLLKLADVQWELRDLVPRVSLSKTWFRPIDFLDANLTSCLKKQHILFVGDSVTRYQYMSLVFFLHHGVWPAPYVVDGRPHPCWEQSWPGWQGYLQASPTIFGGKELCDCHRGDKLLRNITFENRFYTEAEIAVSFLAFVRAPSPNASYGFFRNLENDWRTEGLQGHYGFPPYTQLNNEPFLAGYCNNSADYKMGLAEAFTELIPLLKPSTVILNTGIWTPSGQMEDDLLLALQRSSNVSASFIWKTTTAGKGGTRERPSTDMFALDQLHGSKWGVYDSWALTQAAQDASPQNSSALLDYFHFHPYVYQGLNEVLLNAICPDL